jgi:hypothetical protein
MVSIKSVELRVGRASDAASCRVSQRKENRHSSMPDDEIDDMKNTL